ELANDYPSGYHSAHSSSIDQRFSRGLSNAGRLCPFEEYRRRRGARPWLDAGHEQPVEHPAGQRPRKLRPPPRVLHELAVEPSAVGCPPLFEPFIGTTPESDS